MAEEKELRNVIVRNWLLPTDCDCDRCKQNGKTKVPCRVRSWLPPQRLTLTKPPKDVAECVLRYEAAGDAFDKKMDGPLKNVDVMEELTKMVLLREALLIWLAEQVYKLPGQPNSMAHMMLCNITDLRAVHAFYSIEENQRQGLKMKARIRKKYG